MYVSPRVSIGKYRKNMDIAPDSDSRKSRGLSLLGCFYGESVPHVCFFPAPASKGRERRVFIFLLTCAFPRRVLPAPVGSRASHWLLCLEPGCAHQAALLGSWQDRHGHGCCNDQTFHWPLFLQPLSQISCPLLALSLSLTSSPAFCSPPAAVVGTPQILLQPRI